MNSSSSPFQDPHGFSSSPKDRSQASNRAWSAESESQLGTAHRHRIELEHLKIEHANEIRRHEKQNSILLEELRRARSEAAEILTQQRKNLRFESKSSFAAEKGIARLRELAGSSGKLRIDSFDGILTRAIEGLCEHAAQRIETAIDNAAAIEISGIDQIIVDKNLLPKCERKSDEKPL